jgi:hypothetical protein
VRSQALRVAEIACKEVSSIGSDLAGAGGPPHQFTSIRRFGLEGPQQNAKTVSGKAA